MLPSRGRILEAAVAVRAVEGAAGRLKGVQRVSFVIASNRRGTGVLGCHVRCVSPYSRPSVCGIFGSFRVPDGAETWARATRNCMDQQDMVLVLTDNEEERQENQNSTSFLPVSLSMILSTFFAPFIAG